MNINRFSLGIRFAALAEQPHKDFARKIFEGIFSVLTLSELEDLTLYGGADPFTPAKDKDEESDIYLVVLMGGKLKQMRRVYRAIAGDAALGMYMVHDRPYVENNRLYRIDGLDYFGQIRANGRIEGGDGTLDGITVPKKRGRRKPVGKGIKVLLAPEDYGRLSSTDAIKRLTVAARRHFQGVKLAPFPLGGDDIVRSVVMGTSGALRKTIIADAVPGGKHTAYYGVISGKTAVLSTAEAFCPGGVSSLGAGEMLRRALDEGLKRIILSVQDNCMGDNGMGFARALGVSFFDAQGEELEPSPAALELIAKAEADYIHPRLAETELLCMAHYAPSVQPQGAPKLIAALNAALGLNIAPDAGFAQIACALGGGRMSSDYNDMLDAINFDKLARNTALMVTGCCALDAAAMQPGKPMYSIIKRCAALNIPVALLVNRIEDGAAPLYSLTNAGIMTIGVNAATGEDEAARCFDDAADRMFRLIRMGRDVEKIGAPKQPKTRSWFAMMLDSWKK